MRDKLTATTQVLCALALVLSLSLVTLVPVMAAEFPSISPTTAQYDLDDPAEVMTAINWGIASSVVAVTDDRGNLTPGLGRDYVVLVKHLIILNSYLENKLTRIGDSVELIIKFDVGAASFNITAIGTQPSISPTATEYNLDGPRDVKTTVTWGIATSVTSIIDGDGYSLTGTQYAVTPVSPGVSADVTIRSTAYLAGKLTDIGDKVVLTIRFNRGDPVALNITAIGTHPSISPTTAQYNIDSPTDVRTTITWGIASSVASVMDNYGYTLSSAQYTVTPISPGISANLTISSTYLAARLPDIDSKVLLTIKFNRGNNASFEVTATGVHASLSPEARDYDLDNPADVTTTITWNTANTVTSIVDDDAHTLTASEYALTTITPGVSANLTIRRSPYLASKLTNIGDKVILTIRFDLGNNATFTITAVGIHPSVSPQTRDYDLDTPSDITTTITWNTANSVTSIVDDDGHTLIGTEYSLTPVVPGMSANLTIRKTPYLASKLTDIGDKVILTVKFDLGNDATFTITATGIQPRISPKTKEYDLDNPADAVTTVTWGTATAIVSVTDDDRYTLIRGTDYTLTSTGAGNATLTIRAGPYLQSKHMDIGKSVVLTIDFNIGADATFTITAIGVQPSISPVAADHDVIERNNVITTITWGSARSVVSVVDNKSYLLEEGVHYTITPVSPGVSANLTILSSPYLARKLRNFGDKVVLTIGFDVGRDATLTITVPEICFVATATYGTPMADEIQVLREFRDEYLLANRVGQALVSLYYKVSPPIAQFIAEHPSLKPIARAGLLPAIAIGRLAINTTTVQNTAVLVLLVLFSATLAVWVVRRRRRSAGHT